MRFATPEPKAPAIAAASTATSRTARRLAWMKVARRVNIGLLLIGLGCESPFGRLAPSDGGLGELDPHLQGQVGTGRSLARVRFDRAQVRERALLACPHRANDVDPPLGEAVGEEQLQHALVAKLVRRAGVVLEPALERRRAGLGQLVDGARAATRGLMSPADEALVLEALELRVDLPVARGPEVARRLVDERLDLVTGALPERDHPEDHAARGAQVGCHGSAGYINTRYMQAAMARRREARHRLSRAAAWLPGRRRGEGAVGAHVGAQPVGRDRPVVVGRPRLQACDVGGDVALGGD